MNPIFPLILATGIYYPANDSLNSNRQEALKAIGKVAAEEMELSDKLKIIEKKYLDPDVKYYGGWTLFFGRVVVEKQVSYKWTF